MISPSLFEIHQVADISPNVVMKTVLGEYAIVLNSLTSMKQDSNVGCRE
jgi:hypothetical protein